MNKKNIMVNTAMSVCLQALNVAIGLVIPRLILTAFGSEMNGLVSSINQFMMYLTLVESGLTQVAVVSLYKPLVAKDASSVNYQLSAASYLYKKTALLYVSLLFIMALLYPIIINHNYNSDFVRSLVIVLGIHYFIDFIFIGKYKVLLIADQKQYVVSAILIITNILFFVSEIVLLRIGASIILVKLVIPLVHLLQFVMIKLYTTVKYTGLDFRIKTRSDAITGRNSAILHQITGLIMSSTDITLLTFLGVGFKEISVYSVYNIVTIELNSFLSAITNAIVPSFGKALVQNEGEIKEQFSKLTCLFYFIVHCIFGPLLLLYTGFIELYTHNVNDVNYVRPVLALLFCICFILNSIKSPYIMLIQSSGRYEETRNATIVEAAINIIVTIPLIIRWGIIGALVGTVCAHIYRYVQLIRFGKKSYSISVKNNVFMVLVYLITDTVISVLLYHYWIANIVYTSWMIWILTAVIITAIFFCVNLLIFYIMDKDGYKYYIKLLRLRMRVNG